MSVLDRAYRHIIDSALTIQPGLHILVHGYGNAVPNGVAVVNFHGAWRLGGPWLRPSLARYRIDYSTVGRELLRELIGMFNSMLANLAAAYPGRVHYLDLRAQIREADWRNELHLTDAAYKRVAALFHERMRQIGGAL